MSDKGDGAEGGNEEEDFAKSYPNINEDLKENIDDFFDIFDKDRDNFINYFDLTSLLRWLQFNPTEREMKKYIDKYDPGKSNLIGKKVVYEIVNKKVLEPDTIEELIEATRRSRRSRSYPSPSCGSKRRSPVTSSNTMHASDHMSAEVS